MNSIRLRHLREIYTYVEQITPIEACGLIAFSARASAHVFDIENILNSRNAFEMNPHQQVAAMLAMERQKWDLGVIFHSHPFGPMEPSKVDIQNWRYPECGMLILGPSSAGWSAALFTVTDGHVYSLPLVLRGD
ncbi:MAG: M67 family peptidase [Anaerolineae bacterium]|nr:MAG: M67 family peptidase [Anaerolineae bacterium]